MKYIPLLFQMLGLLLIAVLPVIVYSFTEWLLDFPTRAKSSVEEHLNSICRPSKEHTETHHG